MGETGSLNHPDQLQSLLPDDYDHGIASGSPDHAFTTAFRLVAQPNGI